MKTNLLNMNLQEMGSYFQEIGEQKFRANQVFSWIYKGAASFDDMTDLSKKLRDRLKEIAEIPLLKVMRVQISVKDGTRKYLFELEDGNTIESVLMRYHFGNTICVSTQAGCRMNCSFCASAKNGLSRNLEASEIAGQILAVERESGVKISNVVVMGTGEPFDNFEELCRFIEMIHEEKGLNLGLRSITVSTCGVIPKIKEFAERYPQVNLAISLHAANDELRSKLMPVNKKYPLNELIPVCRQYAEETGRRITFEYALIRDVNDRPEDARELSGLLRGILCHVNLIPLNEVDENTFSATDRKRASEFREILEKSGIPATVRREMGGDISAACGQLRLNAENTEKN